MYKPEDIPLGVSEVAIVLSVKPDTVSSWQIRKQMPIPDSLINDGRTRLWRMQTILDWASATGRNNANLNYIQGMHKLLNNDNNGKKVEDFTSKASKFDDQWGDLADYKE